MCNAAILLMSGFEGQESDIYQALDLCIQAAALGFDDAAKYLSFIVSQVQDTPAVLIFGVAVCTHALSRMYSNEILLSRKVRLPVGRLI